ncbi:hypothetical protein [Hydrogenophaga palleronii]|uniref:hypothetical protein n=1 Tax=Hydrogenophaga palleronii TaxID=65655 RepID=UPI0008259B15|nr:hypothetical protein [Hydrogenophaga palleronii]
MRQNLVQPDVFSSRLNAVEALLRFPAVTGTNDLNALAGELDSTSASLANPTTAVAYAAFAGLVRIAATLVQWHGAVLTALPDADRFLRSAKARHQLWLKEYEAQVAAARLVQASRTLPDVSSPDDAVKFLNGVGATPLPLGMLVQDLSFARIHGPNLDERPTPEPLALTVAFLKFQVDSVDVQHIHQLTPGEVHDLELEVRVSRWPEEHSELQLTPVSVEPASTYDFPSFNFSRPDGEPPYILHQRARAILKASQGLHARPFEFKYAAEFLPPKSEQPVAIVGHRTLLIDGTDPSRSICGYPAMDSRLIEFRETLRKAPGMAQSELLDLLKVLAALFNLAGSAVQDALFPEKRSEAQFQLDVRAALRRSPSIGIELDEHANAAGGITDLSFRGIPIELKVESSALFALEDGRRFAFQVASYAVAKGKKTAVLCVLDCSGKNGPPRDPAQLVGILSLENGVQVCVLVIQGNLQKPSALSRGSAHQ